MEAESGGKGGDCSRCFLPKGYCDKIVTESTQKDWSRWKRLEQIEMDLTLYYQVLTGNQTKIKGLKNLLVLH